MDSLIALRVEIEAVLTNSGRVPVTIQPLAMVRIGLRDLDADHASVFESVMSRQFWVPFGGHHASSAGSGLYYQAIAPGETVKMFFSAAIELGDWQRLNRWYGEDRIVGHAWFETIDWNLSRSRGADFTLAEEAFKNIASEFAVCVRSSDVSAGRRVTTSMGKLGG